MVIQKRLTLILIWGKQIQKGQHKVAKCLDFHSHDSIDLKCSNEMKENIADNIIKEIKKSLPGVIRNINI